MVLGVGIHHKNKLPPGAVAAEVDFNIQPSFLEPGRLPRGRVDEPVEVKRPDDGGDGSVQVRLWQATAVVSYQRDPQGHLTQLVVVPLSADATSDGWNVWRHRHGYVFVRGQGYFWNTLGDYRYPIRDEQGARYDAFLKAVWSYWTVVGLETQRLKGAPRDAAPTGQPYRRVVRVALRDGKLARPASVDFQINPWHVPLRVQLDVQSSTSSAILEMVDGFRWKYDMDDWRRRHGYRKTFFFGYEWLEGFPAPFPMNNGTGRELDHLLDRTMAFWSEAIAAQVVTELDWKIAASAASPG